MAEGLEVTVLTVRAPAPARQGDHEATLRAQEKNSDCHLLPSETVFYALMGDASHAAFRKVSALVKARGGEGFSPKSSPERGARPEPVRAAPVTKPLKKAAPPRKQRG